MPRAAPPWKRISWWVCAAPSISFPAKVRNSDFACKLSSSSAAGGLGMVTIGLIPELSAEAARRAALGAGAKVIKVYAFRLSGKEIQELESLNPDILLLAGGTDGGNADVILENAKKLALSRVHCPIVIAGNKVAADEVNAILSAAGKPTLVTDNVMPEVNVLNVEPAREMIRRVFIERIIEAKGLKRAEAFVEGILMPTPTAVLKAARLLSQGTPREKGLGDLVIVDIGGATTDVHSIGLGSPCQAGFIFKGLPEPLAKRTVEGDLGIRYNATSILCLRGPERLLSNACLETDRLAPKIEALCRNVEFLPPDGGGPAARPRPGNLCGPSGHGKACRDHRGRLGTPGAVLHSARQGPYGSLPPDRHGGHFYPSPPGRPHPAENPLLLGRTLFPEAEAAVALHRCQILSLCDRFAGGPLSGSGPADCQKIPEKVGSTAMNLRGKPRILKFAASGGN